MRIDRDQTVLTEQQRVPVGLRLRDHIAGDVAVGAGVVVDDDGLAEEFGELLAHDARRDIGRTAGDGRYDELDWARRVLRECRGGSEC